MRVLPVIPQHHLGREAPPVLCARVLALRRRLRRIVAAGPRSQVGVYRIILQRVLPVRLPALPFSQLRETILSESSRGWDWFCSGRCRSCGLGGRRRSTCVVVDVTPISRTRVQFPSLKVRRESIVRTALFPASMVGTAAVRLVRDAVDVLVRAAVPTMEAGKS